MPALPGMLTAPPIVTEAFVDAANVVGWVTQICERNTSFLRLRS